MSEQLESKIAIEDTKGLRLAKKNAIVVSPSCNILHLSFTIPNYVYNVESMSLLVKHGQHKKKIVLVLDLFD